MAEPVNETKSTATDKKAAAENIDDVKAVSAIGYLGILFLVPMLTNPKSEYAMFHANQGLLLGITAFAINTLGWAIPFVGWFLLIPFGNIFVFVLFIMGIIAALNGEMKRLPLIGGFDLLKVQK